MRNIRKTRVISFNIMSTYPNISNDNIKPLFTVCSKGRCLLSEIVLKKAN